MNFVSRKIVFLQFLALFLAQSIAVITSTLSLSHANPYKDILFECSNESLTLQIEGLYSTQTNYFHHSILSVFSPDNSTHLLEILPLATSPLQFDVDPVKLDFQPIFDFAQILETNLPNEFKNFETRNIPLVDEFKCKLNPDFQARHILKQKRKEALENFEKKENERNLHDATSPNSEDDYSSLSEDDFWIDNDSSSEDIFEDFGPTLDSFVGVGPASETFLGFANISNKGSKQPIPRISPQYKNPLGVPLSRISSDQSVRSSATVVDKGSPARTPRLEPLDESGETLKVEESCCTPRSQLSSDSLVLSLRSASITPEKNTTPEKPQNKDQSLPVPLVGLTSLFESSEISEDLSAASLSSSRCTTVSNSPSKPISMSLEKKKRRSPRSELSTGQFLEIPTFESQPPKRRSQPRHHTRASTLLDQTDLSSNRSRAGSLTRSPSDSAINPLRIKLAEEN